MLISVVLPAPFSPRSATTSRGRTSSEIASLATSGPNRFVTPTMRRTGGPLISAKGGAPALHRRLRLGVVDVDAEEAVAALLLARLHLLLDRCRDLAVERAER